MPRDTRSFFRVLALAVLPFIVTGCAAPGEGSFSSCVAGATAVGAGVGAAGGLPITVDVMAGAVVHVGFLRAAGIIPEYKGRPVADKGVFRDARQLRRAGAGSKRRLSLRTF